MIDRRRSSVFSELIHGTDMDEQETNQSLPLTTNGPHR